MGKAVPRILIVDDERRTASSLSRLMEKEGYKPAVAEDGEFSSQRHHLLHTMMGPSKQVEQLITVVDRVAQSDYTIIIQGETGTGKELIAQAIHNSSRRSHAPFIAVDCGAIPETLLESELFGYEKGAFTGAEHQRPGKFELVQQGTLLLDEISNMPLSSQVKLLRVLQEKQVYRLGSSKPLKIDVRLLAASNLHLQALTESGAFRRDLFYRLNDFTITLPPLRERKEDICYLANRFLATANEELNKEISGFSRPASELMVAYSWPGNVRQLRSTVRRAALLADTIITERHLDIHSEPAAPVTFTSDPLGGLWNNLSLKEIVRHKTIAIERDLLRLALKHTGGNKAKAARMLHIDYKTLHTKVKQLGISLADESAEKIDAENEAERNARA